MWVSVKKITVGIVVGSVVSFTLYLLTSIYALAQEAYLPLVTIPGLSGEVTSIPDFVNTVYKITIGIGALLGVIKIAMAGVKYSMSDVVPTKESAKKDILGVLLGLAILLLPWVVLNTIYPGLLNLDFADKIYEAAPNLREVESGGEGFQNRNVTTVNEDGLSLYRTECSYIETDASCIKRCTSYVLSLPNFDRFGAGEPWVEDYGAWGDAGTCNIGFYTKENEVVTKIRKISLPCVDMSGENVLEDGQCLTVCNEEAKASPGFLQITLGPGLTNKPRQDGSGISDKYCYVEVSYE